MNYFKLLYYFHKGVCCRYFICRFRRSCREYLLYGSIGCLDCAKFKYPCKSCAWCDRPLDCDYMHK